MIKITEKLIPPAYKNARPGIMRTGFRGITYHETDNTSKGSNAMAHANLLYNGWKDANGVIRSTSWHYCVDSGGATRSVPEAEVAWCQGDGRGDGNMKTISIEICVNSDGDFNIARKNACILGADILFRNGIKNINGYVWQHNSWSGKNCPRNIRAKGLWNEMLLIIQAELNAKWTAKSTSPAPAPSPPVQPKPFPVTTPSSVANTTEIKINDKITIKPGAIYGGLSNARGKKVPSQYTGKRYTVIKSAIHKNTPEALIKELNSWIALAYLIKQ